MSKVCIAICNYNHEKYLKESIRSIINQDYENLDIAVIDDGSKDRDLSREISESFKDSRIRFIQIQNNTGKWHCLNTAFSTTDAEICTSHDADDVSLPWRISLQLEALKKSKTAHNLCGFHHCWNEEQVRNSCLLSQRPENFSIASPEQVFQSVLFGYRTKGINHYFTGEFETAGVSSFFMKSIWDIGFRFNPPKQGLRILHSEDSDFNCRVTLALKNTSLLLEKPYLYRRNTSTNCEEK